MNLDRTARSFEAGGSQRDVGEQLARSVTRCPGLASDVSDLTLWATQRQGERWSEAAG